ncbi:MAG: hypothetical protein E6K52_15005 [Gammaproteobacteria bacterium]|nr:MAG: hypothetical protein E6K52_15005 [Gammaproteobacteria bacterium]
MRTKNPRLGSGQRGMVLISSLLLLLIITILGVSMFRSFSIQEKVAGNVREKQRALQAAEIAQQYAEWWLAQGNNSAVTPVLCNSLLSANLSQGQVCSNALNLTAIGGVTVSDRRVQQRLEQQHRQRQLRHQFGAGADSLVREHS